MAMDQPDWGRIAGKFDVWLPHIAPVGEALIEALQLVPGQRLLDLACGTGEPALTIARRYPPSMHGGVDIIATDAAAGMIEAARRKAERAGLTGIDFRVAAINALDFPPASFDRISCRFGMMFCDDPLQGFASIHRLLKSNGRWAVAVWSTPQSMTTMWWAHLVFKDRLPPENQPPLIKATALGAPGVLAAMLGDAGFKEVVVEARSLVYRFASFDAYWEMVLASEILKPQFDALPAAEVAVVRLALENLAQPFLSAEGLLTPHEYLLAYGGR